MIYTVYQAYKFRPKLNWESEAKRKFFFAHKAKRSEANDKAKRSEQSEIVFQNWEKIESLNFVKQSEQFCEAKRTKRIFFSKLRQHWESRFGKAKRTAPKKSEAKKVLKKGPGKSQTGLKD